MMPHESVTSDIAQFPSMHLDVNKISTFELKIEDTKDKDSYKQMKQILSAEMQDTRKASEGCATSLCKEAEVTVLNSLCSGSCEDNSCDCSNSIMNTKVPMLSDKAVKTGDFIHHSQYAKKTILDLEEYSLKELQKVLEDLTSTIETVSSELVQLLLENDSLQQESDARNVAIEQLLKITVKNNETEPKPIQMSVILPSDDSSDDEP